MLEAAKAEGADFTNQVKNNSTNATKDKGGEVKFDSGTADIPSQLKAAFKLDENGISTVSSDSQGQDYSASYYIVKLNKKTEKVLTGRNTKTSEESLLSGRKQDTTYIRSIVAKAMTNANIKVQNDAFKSTFNQIFTEISVLETSSSSSSSKK